jgi:hypothetical protein
VRGPVLWDRIGTTTCSELMERGGRGVLPRPTRQWRANVVSCAGMREWARLPWIIGAVLVGAFLSRSVWLSDASFHPDESTVLWMALDAVRDPQIPDHGLISTYGVHQAPGLVWVTMPFVAVGGGRPEPVIVGFAMLNAAAIALLVATVARACGLLCAATLGVFLVVGPDAFFSAAVWHPSLYTAAVAVLLTAGIRLRTAGSHWWAAALLAVPGLYALIHYSGVVLFAPALALLVLSRRTWKQLVAPAAVAVGVVVCAWVPFLSFEVDRDWVDLRTAAGAGDSAGSLGHKLGERVSDLGFALTHLGQSIHDSVGLTWVLWPLVVLAVVVALTRRQWWETGFLVPAAVVATGVLAQVAVDQGGRQDVLMLWLVPLYALAAWATAQVAGLMRNPHGRLAVTAAVAMLVAVVGGVDLVRAIRATPESQRLANVWHQARTGAPVRYLAGVDPDSSANTLYLPCDPPYDWGSEVWYLREVLRPGRGLRDAAGAGAFRWRAGPPCADRDAKLHPK